MPESPDFESIARMLHDTFGCDHGTDAETAAAQVAMIAEQLRLVWNARGELDLATVDATLASLMGSTASGPYVKQIDRAIKLLDR